MKQLDSTVLAQFIGTENLYRHGLARNVLFTDGVKYVADQGAYWLLDEIVLAQRLPKVARQEFQLWKLVVAGNGTATLFCEDGNDNRVYKKAIPFTDFPDEGIDLYFCNSTILLPSEY